MLLHFTTEHLLIFLSQIGIAKPVTTHPQPCRYGPRPVLSCIGESLNNARGRNGLGN